MPRATAGCRGVPDFLVIGAMKSGTTTLYFDLASQPSIGMTTVREPSVLVRAEPDEAADYYRRMFAAGPEARRLGEVSSLYSKLPQHAGIPERARRVLGADLRLIYLVRNPVERAISHHHHAFAAGVCGPDVNAAVRSDDSLVDFGRYAMQLGAWLRVFPPESALVMRFEDYVADRASGLQRVGEFLSVSVDAKRIRADQAFNRSEGKEVPGRLLRLLSGNLDLVLVRRAIPERLRQRLRRPFFRPATARPRPPRADTIDLLVDRLAPDAERLASLIGWKAPIWDFEATRLKYAEVQP